MNSNFSMILIPLKLCMHFQCLINSFPTTPKPPLRNNELHNFTSSPLVFIYPVCLISKSLDDPKIMHTHYMAKRTVKQYSKICFTYKPSSLFSHGLIFRCQKVQKKFYIWKLQVNVCLCRIIINMSNYKKKLNKMV